MCLCNSVNRTGSTSTSLSCSCMKVIILSLYGDRQLRLLFRMMSPVVLNRQSTGTLPALMDKNTRATAASCEKSSPSLCQNSSAAFSALYADASGRVPGLQQYPATSLLKLTVSASLLGELSALFIISDLRSRSTSASTTQASGYVPTAVPAFSTLVGLVAGYG